MDWQSLSTHDHARLRFAEALLPLGTVEAHDGGPVGTDNLIPLGLCSRLSERLKMPALPLMPYGLTQSLLAYPGGCTLSAETLQRVLLDLARSLARHGLARLFVINGHGGNTAVLREAAARLAAEDRVCVAIIDWWWEVQKEAKELFGEEGMGHAAIDEMAMLLGLYPELRARIPAGVVPSYYCFKGVQAYPAPRPVMTYERAGERVDFSRLDPDRCMRFADIVTDRVEQMIVDIRAGWLAIGKPPAREARKRSKGIAQKSAKKSGQRSAQKQPRR